MLLFCLVTMRCSHWEHFVCPIILTVRCKHFVTCCIWMTTLISLFNNRLATTVNTNKHLPICWISKRRRHVVPSQSQFYTPANLSIFLLVFHQVKELNKQDRSNKDRTQLLTVVVRENLSNHQQQTRGKRRL